MQNVLTITFALTKNWKCC